ncbi:MAG: hypothetical protein S4CHLAM7_04220 [Chlamydiae bacterium]|nr:hypothetical protein [Chlamydiota bacterium]
MENILLINERGPDFWNPYRLSENTSYAQVNGKEETVLNYHEFKKKLDSLANKRILVLIHGLKNPRERVLSNYQAAHKNIQELTSTLNDTLLTRIRRFISSYTGFWAPDEQNPYDAIVGISWPSYDHEFYYYQAKENATKVAPKIAEHLKLLTHTANEVDVVAHSMGNLVLFEALKSANPSEFPHLNHIYSIAAAVPQNALNEGSYFNSVTNLCKKLFVLYSMHDEALKWPFYLAEGGQIALGFKGANHEAPMSSNVTSIDCSAIAPNHSAYLQQDQFYRFIERTHNECYPLLNRCNQVKLDNQANLIEVL